MQGKTTFEEHTVVSSAKAETWRVARVRNCSGKTEGRERADGGNEEEKTKKKREKETVKEI